MFKSTVKSSGLLLLKAEAELIHGTPGRIAERDEAIVAWTKQGLLDDLNTMLAQFKKPFIGV